MFPRAFRRLPNGNTDGEGIIAEWQAAHEDTPLAELVFKDGDLEVTWGVPGIVELNRVPTQGIKWVQNGRMYGYWEVGLDIKHLAFRWWWSMVMVDSLWAQLITRVYNKLRGYKR